jgi:hypothetical protein
VKRFLMALVFAALAMTGAQVSAKAATIFDLGDVTNSATNQNAGPASGPVDLDVKFSLTKESDVTLSLSNFVIGGFFDIANFSATSSDLTLSGGLGGPFSFAGVLVAGDYLVHVTGTAIGSLGGLVHVALSATQTPIPGALLLFVTAIGGMAGFAGLRRRNSAAA